MFASPSPVVVLMVTFPFSPENLKALSIALECEAYFHVVYIQKR
jgi:hypothetical protein